MSERAPAILEILGRAYAGAVTALHFNTPFELLVATVLSAQSTDRQVNKITARLFSRYNTPQQMAILSQADLEEMIRGCGLFKTKARHLLEAARLLVEEFGGEVPQSMEELLRLPGVGRKTANVILSNAFQKDALAVDTHVFRVAHRLGMASGKTPEKTEEELRCLIPRRFWSQAHHWLIQHGRQVCRARSPRCRECQLQELCPSKTTSRSLTD